FAVLELFGADDHIRDLQPDRRATTGQSRDILPACSRAQAAWPVSRDRRLRSQRRQRRRTAEPGHRHLGLRPGRAGGHQSALGNCRTTAVFGAETGGTAAGAAGSANRISRYIKVRMIPAAWPGAEVTWARIAACESVHHASAASSSCAPMGWSGRSRGAILLSEATWDRGCTSPAGNAALVPGTPSDAPEQVTDPWSPTSTSAAAR